MAGRVRVVLLSLAVIFGSLLDPVAAAEEEASSSNCGFGFELLISKMEFLQDQLDKLKHIEESILKRMDSMMDGQARFEKNVEAKLNHLSSKVLHLQSEAKKEFQEVKVELDNHGAEQTKISKNLVNLQETVDDNLQVVLSDTRLLKSVTTKHSCSDAKIKSSGRYWVHPFKGEEPFEAYCEHGKFGGGWHVIQYRFNGSVDFYRGWEEYKTGFGDLTGEFFVGLETVHRLTTSKKHILMVEVESFDGKYGYARYDNFRIGSEEEKFELTELGEYTGTAGDSLTYSKGGKFSTKDRDHDTWGGNCASDEKGAWWYKRCAYSSLNGPYVDEESRQSNYWYNLNTKWQGVEMTRMMIKEA